MSTTINLEKQNPSIRTRCTMEPPQKNKDTRHAHLKDICEAPTRPCSKGPAKGVGSGAPSVRHIPGSTPTSTHHDPTTARQHGTGSAPALSRYYPDADPDTTRTPRTG